MDVQAVPIDLTIVDSNIFPKENVPKSSIRKKFEEKVYYKTRSLFPLYNDLKIAYRTQIAQYPIGSKDYQTLTDIFNFSLDLILREGVRFSLLLPDQVLTGESTKAITNGKNISGDQRNGVSHVSSGADVATGDSEESDHEKDDDVEQSNEREEEEYEEDEYEAEALDGFQKIYADVQEQYGESFYILTQNGPLFTSLNGRSSLDPRDYQIPKMFNTTRSLPHTGPATAYQLSHISPKISQVPHPAIPPTEFMTAFVHPNGAPLPLPTWLNYSVYQSFAPTIDQTHAVLDETVVNSIWFEKYTKKKMESAEAIEELLKARVEKVKESAMDLDTVEEEEKPETAINEESNAESTQNADIEMADSIEEKKDTKIQQGAAETSESNSLSEVQEYSGELESEDIDFVSTLTWSPDHFIDNDEVEAARAGTESALISSLLLELQNMQRVRLARSDSNAFAITPAERRLATKIQNMLVRALDDTTPAELGVTPATKYPVLQATYQGVLQVPEMKPAGGQPSMRPSRYITRKQRRMM